MGTRYFYYLLLQNMVLNVILFVPDTLIAGRFDGTMMSVLVAIPIGLTLMFVFLHSLTRVPDKTVPEILMAAFPKWVAWVILLYFASFWFVAGSITILSFSLISQRYALPDTSPWLLISLFVLLVVYVARMNMRTILQGLELMFILNVPVVALLVVKSFLSDEFNWWAVQDIFTHTLHPPSIETMSSATFVFAGYAHMIIFHPIIKARITGWKHCVLIAFFALSTLLTSFLIPVGYHGTNAVSQYVFNWVAAADAMKLEYFIVERVLYIFLLLYLMIALISTILFWHVSSRTIASLLPSKWAPDFVLLAFIAGIFIMAHLLNTQFNLSRFAENWLIVRFFSEIAVIAIITFAVRRVRRST